MLVQLFPSPSFTFTSHFLWDCALHSAQINPWSWDLTNSNVMEVSAS